MFATLILPVTLFFCMLIFNIKLAKQVKIAKFRCRENFVSIKRA